MTQIAFSNWKPHTITEIDCEDRVGFIGRGTAIVVDGVECFLMAQKEEDLMRAALSVVGPKFNAKDIHKTTVVESNGISVQLPEKTAEDAASPPAPPAPSDVPMYNNRPVAKYIEPTLGAAPAEIPPEQQQGAGDDGFTDETRPIAAATDDDEL